ncbi:hypothetical protein LH336_17075 [Leptospira borgpetersenii]|nr:hypothetical protein [Leptospira borgpetersenii]UVA66039.1 hypothetical protein LH336_17075 [Leptospira borgpetersenii]
MFERNSDFFRASLIFSSICFRFSSTKSSSQNPKKNISKRSGKFLKSVGVPTETVVLTVFFCPLRL